MAFDVCIAVLFTTIFFIFLMDGKVYNEYRKFLGFDLFATLSIGAWFFCIFDKISVIGAVIGTILVCAALVVLTKIPHKDVKVTDGETTTDDVMEHSQKDPFIGRTGRIKTVINMKNYIGVFFDDSQDVLLYSEDTMSVDDVFVVTEILEGRIVGKKQ